MPTLSKKTAADLVAVFFWRLHGQLIKGIKAISYYSYDLGLNHRSLPKTTLQPLQKEKPHDQVELFKSRKSSKVL